MLPQESLRVSKQSLCLICVKTASSSSSGMFAGFGGGNSFFFLQVFQATAEEMTRPRDKACQGTEPSCGPEPNTPMPSGALNCLDLYYKTTHCHKSEGALQ